VVHLIAHSRLIIGSQPLAHMANYAHHQSRSGAHGGNPDALADCVFAAEGMLGEILIDHDHRFTTDAIVFIEEATVAQWNAHHFQVVRRYARRQRDGLLVRWRGRGGVPIRHRVFSFAHRDNIGHGENKYAPVQMELFRARQAAWPKRNKWVNADECEYHAEQASSNA